MVRQLGFPLTLNVVLHRANIGRVEGIIALAEQLKQTAWNWQIPSFTDGRSVIGPACYQGTNRFRQAMQVTAKARERLAGKMDILFVVPDYYSDRPKPCMDGWAKRYLTVNPVGDVLPCPTASEIPNLRFENVRPNRSTGSGGTPNRLIDFAGPNGCRNRVRVASFGKLILEAVVARPRCSPADRPRLPVDPVPAPQLAQELCRVDS